MSEKLSPLKSSMLVARSSKSVNGTITLDSVNSTEATGVRDSLKGLGSLYFHHERRCLERQVKCFYRCRTRTHERRDLQSDEVLITLQGANKVKGFNTRSCFVKINIS
jgi:hypothetical protein